MPDFAIPLSGLTASQTALSVISNNLANMNTTGYKDTDVSFQDLFYQNIGSTGAGDPEQVGAGVAIGTLSTNFNAGDPQTTGVNTDVAISNNGFFVLQGNGQNLYSRNGEFTVDSSGYLVNNQGNQVLGYTATNGVVNASQTLGPLQVGSGQINPPNRTSSIQLNTNLNAGSNVADSYSTSIDVYDSLGDAHVVTVQFTKTDTNTWNYQMTVPGADVGSASAQTISSGSLTFDQTTGALSTWTDASGNTNSAATDVSGIKISNLADGASDLTFAWNLTKNGAPTLTQMAAANSTPSTWQDGFSSGTLTGFSIDPNGMIEGSFTNGTKVLGQIALAGFSDQAGLDRQGDGNFAATLASGQAAIGAPGTGSLGTLSGGSLEGSNVDISQEFSNLIMAQRQFEANAKSITTFDEITQDTINLKH